ncbi:MAG: NAD-dependent epimerase/dehydratase family protein [Candidatus Omnitrophica bacterium]|nr:NAD-dependent epimerase/dehydratase family protein [Candidatus Omnitrophota bacterium]
MKKVLVTGAGGLIGSEAVSFFCEKDFEVIGIDNNMREYFFGKQGSVLWNISALKEKHSNFTHLTTDIRVHKEVEKVFKKHSFDLIIHTAAQPSHDWAAKEPYTDFAVNAQGTLVLLENTRQHCPEAVFIFLSTNKVYGDRPNELSLIEQETRYELPADHRYYNGIDESMSIDQCKHSLFGASKAAADIITQEYGRYFNMKTAVFRGGCLTGRQHSGVELHGFLSYLVKAIVHGLPYTIYGYKGKQVRDNICAYDVVNACYEFYKAPRIAEVYNIGGSRYSNISMREAISYIEAKTKKKANVKYSEQARSGDHMWYISDVSKFNSHYPAWNFSTTIEGLLDQMCECELHKIKSS